MQMTGPLPPPPDTASAVTATDGIVATVRIARALVQAGRQVDLGGLDRMVGLLCARVLDLPPEQGRTLRPRLLALLAELDELNGALAPP